MLTFDRDMTSAEVLSIPLVSAGDLRPGDIFLRPNGRRLIVCVHAAERGRGDGRATVVHTYLYATGCGLFRKAAGQLARNISARDTNTADLHSVRIIGNYPTWYEASVFLGTMALMRPGTYRYYRPAGLMETTTNSETEGEKPMTTQLYQTKEETPRFGVKLTSDSKGRTVLEMKGTGAVEAFDPADIEKVMPYTVEVVALSGSNKGQPANMRALEGEVEVGDIVLTESHAVLRVTALNTKAASTRHTLAGVKVPTAAIKSPEEDE